MGFIIERTALLIALLALTACSSPGAADQSADTTPDIASDANQKIWFCLVNEDCDDDDDCMQGFCLGDGTCKRVVQPGASCNDGNECTSGDTCVADGTCAGESISCADENLCTIDSCLPDSGCQNLVADDGVPCDDGDLCTTGEVCLAGVCEPSDTVFCLDSKQDDCLVNSCNPQTGGCGLLMPAEEGSECKDGNACTNGDTCNSDGICVPGSQIDCDSGTPCWNSWCNDQTKEGSDPCTGAWKDEGVGCNDGDKCTTSDACAPDGDGMVCTGAVQSCDDGNPCTIGTCDADAGCTYETLEDGASCSLGEGPCYKSGSCSSGTCDGAIAYCDDGNPCTDDLCDPENPGECLNPNNEETCDDEDVCTLDDSCSNGECIGKLIVCDDADVCTDESCDPTEGCVFSFNESECNDGNPTTSDDTCFDGECIGVLGEVITTDKARFPEEEDGLVEIEVLENSLVIQFEDDAESHQLMEGEVLIGLEGPGYLRLIESVVYDGNDAYVETSHAALEDVIEEGSFEFDIPMEMGGYGGYGGEALIWKTIGQDFTGKVLYDDNWGGVDVKVEIIDGGIWFDSGLEVKAYYNPGESNFFVAKLFGDLSFSIDVKGTVSKEVELSKEIVLLPPQTQTVKFYVYGIPVAVQATLQINAGFDFAAFAEGSVQSGLDFSTFIGVGAKYEDYKWWPILEKNVSGSFHSPIWVLEGEASLVGYVRPILSVKLYGAAGPEINFKPYLKLLGELSGFDVCWDIVAGITGGSKMVMDLFFVSIESKDWEFLNFEKSLKSGCLQIFCKPDCSVAKCGPDPECDESCGDCNAGSTCTNGQCIPDCVAKTCQQLGKDCDSWSDKCDGTVNCGGCSGIGEQCLNGQCICEPLTCQETGKECGSWQNGCGGTVSCGGCDFGQCNNGSCPGPCDGVVCPKCQKCDPGNGNCITNAALNNMSCGSGVYCNSGNCVACPSNFCQSNNFSFGAHCDGASKSVVCKNSGACLEQASSDSCQSGCDQNTGKCKGDPCGDGLCNNGETCGTCPGDCGGCCGGLKAQCCAGQKCDAGGICINDICEPQPNNTFNYRYVNVCNNAFWQSQGECFPGNAASDGCGGCSLTEKNDSCTADTCWLRQMRFRSYDEKPVFGSFFKIHHCFENGGNLYKKTGCSQYGTPADLGWIASSPIGIWETPLFLCSWTKNGHTEHWFTYAASECTGAGASVVSPSPWGYMVP